MQRYVRIGLFAISPIMLCACATEGWAPKPGAQAAALDPALDKCNLQARAMPIMPEAATQPVVVATMQQDYVKSCMSAAGWIPDTD